ncbi:hypothetical protein DAPPUDRAFT_116835 [Daphnia pulex]|uniref:Uncharacterized protein n=1 Tax=Daphnia pulex TaxID=6669 RepID=E9HQN5_DAPPU|nr:hypothetical protein DAPPUDRAFT_116835 [Daphnia pulex]|eukprot:EFX65920.1 hypothetical protein DAPPUDRAFT_116835 [Daphnia pulex]
MFNLEDKRESLAPKRIQSRIHYFNMSNLLYYFNPKDFVITSKCNVLMLLVLFKLVLAVIIVTICTRNHVQSGKELPLCLGNLLDNREHHYAKDSDGSYDNSRMISKLGSCQLTRYTFERVVACFNALSDSRMRQQFINFLKIIPDYDRKSKPSPLPFVYHGNMEVTSEILSEILRLRLSFQWQPLVNDTIIDTIRQWATDSQADRPNLIFLGIALWYMIQTPGEHQPFQKQLELLAPLLSQLANVSKVIWLNQYPVMETYGDNGAVNTVILSEKINHYNEDARSELQQSYLPIIWDSSNSLVEEYIRGCILFRQRVQLGMYLLTDPDYSYINCNDHTHPAYSALSQATQLLLHDLCDARKLFSP